MRNVLAILMPGANGLGRTEIEVLSAGSRLSADLGGTLSAATLGPHDAAARDTAFSYGAERVFLCDSTSLTDYRPDVYAAAARQAAETAQADVVLFSSTTAGLELAPLTAHLLRAAAVMDVVGLDGKAEGGGIRVHKPVFGGKAQSILVARNAPVVLALRARSFDPNPRRDGPQGEAVSVPLQTGTPSASWKVISREVEQSEGVRLEDARIVVSGGRGLGGKENFIVLEELGKVLGAALGASRAAVDLGWVPSTWQIGQTGKKVAPDLYVAVGISGASQHIVGIAGAKHVVAVNKDEKAPIFQVAELGVVEDYKTFIPKFVEALKKRKALSA